MSSFVPVTTWGAYPYFLFYFDLEDYSTMVKDPDLSDPAVMVATLSMTGSIIFASSAIYTFGC